MTAETVNLGVVRVCVCVRGVRVCARGVCLSGAYEPSHSRLGGGLVGRAFRDVEVYQD